jgi:hypothetical protein
LIFSASIIRSLFRHNLDGFGGALLGAKAAGNAFEGVQQILVPVHGLGGTGGNAHVTSDAERFVNHHHALVIHFQGKCGADCHAGLALVAGVDGVAFGCFSNPDARLFRIGFFVVSLRTGGFTDATGYAFIREGFQVLLHKPAPVDFLCFIMQKHRYFSQYFCQWALRLIISMSHSLYQKHIKCISNVY